MNESFTPEQYEEVADKWAEEGEPLTATMLRAAAGLAEQLQQARATNTRLNRALTRITPAVEDNLEACRRAGQSFGRRLSGAGYTIEREKRLEAEQRAAEAIRQREETEHAFIALKEAYDELGNADIENVELERRAEAAEQKIAAAKAKAKVWLAWLEQNNVQDSYAIEALLSVRALLADAPAAPATPAEQA